MQIEKSTINFASHLASQSPKKRAPQKNKIIVASGGFLRSPITIQHTSLNPLTKNQNQQISCLAPQKKVKDQLGKQNHEDYFKGVKTQLSWFWWG